METQKVGQLISRQIHHKEYASLNVMTLNFSSGYIGSPHYNKNRDEVIFVLSGRICAHIFDESKKLIDSNTFLRLISLAIGFN